MTHLRIGILALQGCITPHATHLAALGAALVPIRTTADCHEIDGYILPGGESTTMLRLLHVMGLQPLLEDAWRHVPVWGICAGAILLAKEVRAPAQASYQRIDYTIERNSYGAQQASHHAEVAGYPVAFIRAPKIIAHGPGMEVLAASADGDPVWVRQGHVMATCFHPELNRAAPSPMHRYFINMIEAKKGA